MKKIFRVIAVILCISMLFLSGCAAAPAATDTTIGETGLLILRVNPEIEIAYDKDGKVLSLTGKNEDGKRIVSAMQDYTGKSCDSVLQDLIMEIDKAGYFAGEIDGQQKNIVLQIEQNGFRAYYHSGGSSTSIYLNYSGARFYLAFR